ncbi:MAG TPA: hypothetical protein VFF03_09440 [Rhodocyclaceae bacterium]|nr:hypothetical protein [Rhodocyclaceae bacterium]
MRFQSEVVVQGMKRSKGEMDGVKYDSTKFYIDTDLDDRSGNAKGKATTEYSMGTSEEFALYEKLPFPFKAVGSFSQVTTGKVTKIVLEQLQPVKAA